MSESEIRVGDVIKDPALLKVGMRVGTVRTGFTRRPIEVTLTERCASMRGAWVAADATGEASWLVMDNECTGGPFGLESITFLGYADPKPAPAPEPEKGVVSWPVEFEPEPKKPPALPFRYKDNCPKKADHDGRTMCLSCEVIICHDTTIKDYEPWATKTDAREASRWRREQRREPSSSGAGALGCDGLVVRR